MKANENMSFTDIRLPKNFDSARLSHAYIASGSLADIIAMSAVCTGSGARPCMNCAHCNKASRGIHPDIIIIGKPEKKREIIIEQIRELKRDVIIVPNESEKKAYIINDADTMNVNAQNAFLKILEEPPTHAVFILRTATPDELLPTVRSRCVELKTEITDMPLNAVAAEMANDFFSALRLGNASLTAFMFQLDKLDKEQYSEFLFASREKAVEKLKIAASRGEVEICETLSRAERVFAKASEFLDLNVGVGHISGLICAELINIPLSQIPTLNP